MITTKSPPRMFGKNKRKLWSYDIKSSCLKSWHILYLHWVNMRWDKIRKKQKFIFSKSMSLLSKLCKILVLTTCKWLHSFLNNGLSSNVVAWECVSQLLPSFTSKLSNFSKRKGTYLSNFYNQTLVRSVCFS
jgi:hypothetical protein